MKKQANTNYVIPAVACLAVLFILISSSAYADGNGFVTTQIVEETNKIRSFIFGTGVKIVALFGGAWGIIQSFISGSIKPLIVYGGIGLTANFLPKFIDMIF